jgi:hypothetical protein
MSCLVSLLPHIHTLQVLRSNVYMGNNWICSIKADSPPLKNILKCGTRRTKLPRIFVGWRCGASRMRFCTWGPWIKCGPHSSDDSPIPGVPRS